MIKNPYFHPVEKIEEVAKKVADKIVTEAELVLTPEIKAYPEQVAENTPSIEPIKGLTSIIMLAHFNSYQAFHTTGNAIGSIREHTDKEKTPYELILVQNGETGIGFTEDNFKDTYADKVIPNKENLGYAKAVNQGIRISSGEYIAVINNDVQVFDHWLEDLQEALQHVDLIQAYPMYGIPYGRAVESRTLREETLDKTVEECLDDFKDFSCILTRKELFQKIGLFDEQFFAYCEDLDLIRRIEKEGGKVASTKRVRTHHIISMTGSTLADTPKIMDESKEKLKAKWGY